MPETLPPKTVAIFSRATNKKFIAELRARSRVIELPAVSAVKTESFNEAVNPLNFDWLILTDPFAADFFLENLAGQDFDLFQLDSMRICAYGEAVSDRLRFAQVHADVIPQRLETETIFELIKDYVSSETNFDDLRFLIIREETARVELSGLLRGANAGVTELPLYKFEISGGENLTKLKTLLKGGAADEFVFTSPSDAAALRYLFGDNLPVLLKDTRVSATDEVTYQSLLENGLRPLYFTK